MARPRKHSPSRDDMRAASRLARKEAGLPNASVSLRRSSRDRLNSLVRLLNVDSQSMAIDVIRLRIAGTLEPVEGVK